jgi:hypothetical protein
MFALGPGDHPAGSHAVEHPGDGATGVRSGRDDGDAGGVQDRFG